MQLLQIVRSRSTVILPLTSMLSMADKPSRALVLYGDGLARFVSPSHAYFHSLARLAACGFLALPKAPPSESEDERVVRELAVLLDASEWPVNTNGNSTVGDFEKDSIPNKFMGMKAAIVTTHSIVKPLCEKLGVTTLDFQNFVENIHRMPLVADSVASELLHLLGFQDGKTMETSEFDVLFVHVGGAIVLEIEGKTITLDCLEFLSDLVGSILHKAEPGSEIGTRLHLSLVMSYGDVLPDEEFSLSVLKTTDEKNPHLSLLFPLQSYTMRGEKPRNNVRHYSPMLIAQWQYAVTRKDMAESFSFTDFKENGGNLIIPADRFLHEVAFKLWKSPKYGA